MTEDDSPFLFTIDPENPDDIKLRDRFYQQIEIAERAAINLLSDSPQNGAIYDEFERLVLKYADELKAAQQRRAE